VTIGLREEVSRLQDVSGDTEKTSKGGSGHADDLVSVVCGNWDSGSGRWDVSGADGCRSVGDGGVGVDWRTCWVSGGKASAGAAVAVHDGSSGDWLHDGDGSGDRQGSGLGHSVGGRSNDNIGGLRAVGGVGSDDLSGVGDGLVGRVVCHGRAGSESDGCESRELHLDGYLWC